MSRPPRPSAWLWILGAFGTSARIAAISVPKIHNHALGLGGRDIPETIYADLIEAIKDPDAPLIFDADMAKLAPEDR